MVNEANKVMSHGEIAAAMKAQVDALGLVAMREFVLGNGKIADLLYVSHQGAIHIVEVKSDFRPYYLDHARDKYGPWCHYLWLAVPKHEPLMRLAVPGLLSMPSGDGHVGIIEVDLAGPRIVRKAMVQALPKPRLDATRTAIARRVAAGELIPGIKLAAAARAAQKPTGAP